MASNEPFKLLLDGRLFLTSIDKMTQPNIRDYCLERCSLSHDLLGKKSFSNVLYFFNPPPTKLKKEMCGVGLWPTFILFFKYIHIWIWSHINLTISHCLFTWIGNGSHVLPSPRNGLHHWYDYFSSKFGSHLDGVCCTLWIADGSREKFDMSGCFTLVSLHFFSSPSTV